MQVRINSEWHPEKGEYFVIKAQDAFGRGFTFGKGYETRGEAMIDYLVIRDFALFVGEEKVDLVQRAIGSII